ncbi:hypothetical protein [Streptomyces sp. NPDC090022]|uniref:hypothetical protein n=1 Tax=Streptomyces sp. NPDC090022 TaxID=3365920 RepID=UPI00381CC9AE
MNHDGQFYETIFGMPLPPCLVKSIQEEAWMNLADSPRIEEVFGQAPVHPRFYSIAGIRGATQWWREELDEETLECYFGTSADPAPPGHMSRTTTVIIGDLGPDLPFLLDYRGSLANPSVAFLGEANAWREISGNACDLIRLLSRQGG